MLGVRACVEDASSPEFGRALRPSVKSTRLGEQDSGQEQSNLDAGAPVSIDASTSGARP